MNFAIGVMNRKGGTGKTTIACTISVQAACAKTKERVLLVDADVDQADALTWMLGDKDDLESGVVYPTAIPNLDVIWLQRSEELTKEMMATYETIVIDGRPAKRLGNYILGTADMLVCPYTDKTGKAHAARLVAQFEALGKPAFVVHNVITAPPTGRVRNENPQRLAYDKALRTHKWSKARINLYEAAQQAWNEWEAKKGDNDDETF